MAYESSKFYSRSLTVMVSILQMIRDGLNPTIIARNLNLKKSHISYYIKKAKINGHIIQATRKKFRALELTQAGKKFVDQYTKIDYPLTICRAENIQFKADIVQMQSIPSNWKKTEMRNWIQYSAQIDTVRVKLNLGDNPTLLLLSHPVEGDDPFKIFVIMVVQCVNVV